MDSRGQVQVPERGLQPQNSSVAFIPPQREESPLPTLRPPLGLAPVSPEPAWSSRRRSLPPQAANFALWGFLRSASQASHSLSPGPNPGTGPSEGSAHLELDHTAGPPCPCPPIIQHPPLVQRPPPTQPPEHPWGHWIVSLGSDVSGAP